MEKKYQSRFGADGLITAAQFLTEEIIVRIAKKENKVLPHKFWNSPEWKKIFQRQIVAANALLKERDCLQIMSFLRSSKGKWILSLGLKKPILNGCKSFTIPVIALEEDEQGETFVEVVEVIDSEPIMERIKKNKSLWEMLNGTS